MRVKFECEKCGATHNEQVMMLNPPYEIPVWGCPCQKEPTYGPLTVDAVAEALHAAVWAPAMNPTWERADRANKEDFRKEARFVIRLLCEAPSPDFLERYGTGLADNRSIQQWLNDLARQK